MACRELARALKLRIGLGQTQRIAGRMGRKEGDGDKEAKKEEKKPHETQALANPGINKLNNRLGGSWSCEQQNT